MESVVNKHIRNILSEVLPLMGISYYLSLTNLLVAFWLWHIMKSAEFDKSEIPSDMFGKSIESVQTDGTNIAISSIECGQMAEFE